jgi:hypothetical protein
MQASKICAICATTLLTLAACTTEVLVETNSSQTTELDDDFESAARDYGVPADLVKAVSYVETRWHMVVGDEEHEGRPAGAGLFALWGENLSAGAAAAGLDTESARLRTTPNIIAAVARMADIADDLGVSGSNLLAWTPVLEAYSQSDDAEVRQAYANDVFDVLATGAEYIAEDGSIVAKIPPHPEVGTPSSGAPRAAGADYPGAIWRPSPNKSSRGGTAVNLVIIHTCEGAYAGCWGWLKNSSSGVSAHYVVKENGSEITQLVKENEKAWHIAANYKSSLNGGILTNKNGVSTNNFSVGIEHGGFQSQTSFQSGQIEASAKLTCAITKNHNIPRDRNHIVGHGQLQPNNRRDPGPNWPWAHYIDRVKSYCGDGGATPPPADDPNPGTPTPPPSTGFTPIIIDSNQANNDASRAKITLEGTWTSMTSTAGYYGTGYWQATTAQTAAPATFSFYVSAAGPRTIEAWWPASTTRSTEAPFIAFNASGTEVGRKLVNQRTSGSQWVTLGTWNFTPGWNTVALSRWTSGSNVVADAIRVK